MQVYTSKSTALFKTPYSEAYDLAQLFRGIELIHGSPFNDPVDFMSAGLVRRDKWDPFHFDIPLAITSDEATPAIINGNWIGANHGEPCCITLEAPKHGKTLADVGSVWKDDAGVSFTLLRIETEDHLLLVSENTGTKEAYQFVMQITGRLSYVSDGAHPAPIPATGTQKISYLARACQFTEKRIIIIKDGAEQVLCGSAECDSARIEESYILRNPATVAPALTARRPENGFTQPPDLGDYGEPMLLHRMYYHILADGTVLCDFSVEKTMDVQFERWMGAMYQEKQDAFGGGIYRRIPKTLPLTLSDGTFDFNTPISLEPGVYPETRPVLSREYWAVPDSPPDRVVDYFRDAEGHDRLGFACGYLPLFDGEPEKRLRHLRQAGLLNHTRKMYPTFMDGDLTAVRGIAYKKYFPQSRDRASLYTIPWAGKTYIYADFIEENTVQLPVSGFVTLYEKSGDVTYGLDENILTAHGKNGYAVWICE